MTFTCDRTATYHYRDEATGRHYPAWSQIAQVLDPYAWVGVPRPVLEAAQQRGTDVHYLFALLMFQRAGVAGPPEEREPDLCERYAGYLRGLRDWADSRQIEPLKIEETSCHPTHGYAGTPDLKCRYGPRRLLTLVDLKTGAPRVVDRVQVQVYGKMLGYQDCKQFIDLYLDADGTWKERPVTPASSDWAWFLNALAVWQGMVTRNINLAA